MSPPPSSSSSADTNNSSAILSDTFSIRDILIWNPFQQRRSKGTTKKQVEDDDIKYDNHWILILNGSYKGYFDWIPINLRVGQWSMMAILYFRALWCLSIWLVWYDVMFNKNNTNPNGDDRTIMFDMNHENMCSVSLNDDNSNDVAAAQQQQCDSYYTGSSFHSSLFQYGLHHIVRRYWKDNADVILQMSPVILQSSSFYYNTIVAVYMTYICYCIIAHSALSYGAWITYTVQSWTLLLTRHWLYTLSGLFDSSTTSTIHNNTFVVLAELLRFPCAVAHTVTFVVWNFVLVPYILGIALRHDTHKRRDFIRFCTNFRLINLHGMNILFCISNVWYFNINTTKVGVGTTTNSRSLEMADLYLSGISAFLYFTFYLCILDRIGIHLYPIFSPRHSNGIIFIVWTSVILLYIATFHLWQYVIQNS
jgi:hypothetical protein